MNLPQDAWPMPSGGPQPSRLRGGAELHLLVHQHEGSVVDEESATLLVNLVDTSQATQTLKMVLASIGFVRRSSRLFRGPKGAMKLVAFLGLKRFSTVDAVILTAGNSQVNAISVQLVVEEIRALASNGFVVVVDDDCSRWASMRAVSGFLQSEQAASAFVAASLARFLAACRIPLQFTALDANDVVNSFGSASGPAALVEALYLGSERELKFINEDGAKLARAATNVTAIVASSNMRFLGRTTTTLRAALSEDCALTFQAPTNPSLAPFLRQRIAFLQLICVSTAGGHGIPL